MKLTSRQLKRACDSLPDVFKYLHGEQIRVPFYEVVHFVADELPNEQSDTLRPDELVFMADHGADDWVLVNISSNGRRISISPA